MAIIYSSLFFAKVPVKSTIHRFFRYCLVRAERKLNKEFLPRTPYFWQIFCCILQWKSIKPFPAPFLHNTNPEFSVPRVTWPNPAASPQLWSSDQLPGCDTPLQMKGWRKSNINVWFPFMYYQKWNCCCQNRIIMFCLPVSTLLYLWEIYIFPG